MNNTWIVVPVIDSSFDYSQLMSTLKGGYVASDIEVENVDDEGNVIITTESHPNAGMTPPDFSEKIVLVHRNSGYVPTDGTIEIVVDGDFNISKLWNAGIQQAADNGATHIALVNYVSNFNPFIIEESISANQSSDLINISDASLFVVKADSGLNADEQFSVYFADLDLFKRATSLGKGLSSYPQITTFDVTNFINSVSDKIANDGKLYETKYA